MKEKIKYVYNLVINKELALLPSGVAFSFVYAIIPILTLIFYLATTINVSSEFLSNAINTFLPESVSSLLQPVLIQEFSISSVITIVVGLIVIANSFNSVIKANNALYGVENSPYLKRMFKALVISLIIVIIIMFMLVVPVFGKFIITFILNVSGLSGSSEAIIKTIYFVLQFPITLLVIFLSVKFIYILAPDIKIPKNAVNKGALFTTVSWFILTMIFSFYINNIARYDLVYGNLASLVILMLWFYFLSYVLMIGILINKEVVNYNIDKTNTIKLEEIRKKMNKH